MVKDNKQHNKKRRMLLLELQKEIKSLIDNYLVKFGIDKTRGTDKYGKVIQSNELSAEDCREIIEAGGECCTWIDHGNVNAPLQGNLEKVLVNGREKYVAKKGFYEKYFENLFGYQPPFMSVRKRRVMHRVPSSCVCGLPAWSR